MRVKNWGKILDEFLQNFDDYIKQHVETITCGEIHKMYTDFFEKIKDYRGNSSGFTGFSELILFRVIYHIIGGNFILETRKYPESTGLKYFVSKNNKFSIGQNIGFSIGSKRKNYPDIVICDESDNIQNIIQIKVYLTNGKREMKKRLNY